MSERIYVNPGRKLRSEIEAGSLDQMLRAEVGVARGQHPPDSWAMVARCHYYHHLSLFYIKLYFNSDKEKQLASAKMKYLKLVLQVCCVIIC